MVLLVVQCKYVPPKQDRVLVLAVCRRTNWAILRFLESVFFSFSFFSFLKKRVFSFSSFFFSFFFVLQHMRKPARAAVTARLDVGLLDSAQASTVALVLDGGGNRTQVHESQLDDPCQAQSKNGDRQMVGVTSCSIKIWDLQRCTGFISAAVARPLCCVHMNMNMISMGLITVRPLFPRHNCKSINQSVKCGGRIVQQDLFPGVCPGRATARATEDVVDTK